MKKIIVDFDSTIHVRGCDIDDAFALFYLLKKKDVAIPLVTTSFGNSNEDRIYESTAKMFCDLGIEIPLKKGGIFSYDAAESIKALVNHSDDFNILSLGATTNTMKALALGMDPEKLCSFVAMGGITKPLEFKGKIMDELNFSIDFLSTNYVFSKLKNISIVTGNNCIAHKYIIPEEPKYRSKYMNYLESHMRRWLKEFELIYQERELVIWDALAALYLTNPEFFIDEYRRIELSENMMKGYLKKGEDAVVNLPRLKDEIDAMDYIVSVIEDD